jgi:hypothetical protein
MQFSRGTLRRTASYADLGSSPKWKTAPLGFLEESWGYRCQGRSARYRTASLPVLDQSMDFGASAVGWLWWGAVEWSRAAPVGSVLSTILDRYPHLAIATVRESDAGFYSEDCDPWLPEE